MQDLVLETASPFSKSNRELININRKRMVYVSFERVDLFHCMKADRKQSDDWFLH